MLFIAKLQPENRYDLAEPNSPIISIVNSLYQYGNKIVLFTARGYVTGIDWREVTEDQLKRWGVLYHELHFGKPDATFYVDDRMLALEDLQELL